MIKWGRYVMQSSIFHFSVIRLAHRVDVSSSPTPFLCWCAFDTSPLHRNDVHFYLNARVIISYLEMQSVFLTRCFNKDYEVRNCLTSYDCLISCILQHIFRLLTSIGFSLTGLYTHIIHFYPRSFIETSIVSNDGNNTLKV